MSFKCSTIKRALYFQVFQMYLFYKDKNRKIGLESCINGKEVLCSA